MSINPLVAGPQGESSTFKGAFLLEDGEALASGIRNGDWVEGGMAAFSFAVDTVAMVTDPVGTLIGMGFGWLMEHVEPLQGWLNDLTGDAGEVAGFAATWRNIERQLEESARGLQSFAQRDLDDMSGLMIDVYRDHATQTAHHLAAAGTWAGAMGLGLELASTLVQIVHDVVRDAVAQVAGALCSYAIEAACTVGLATPVIIGQASARAAALAKTVGTKLTRLLKSLGALQDLLKRLDSLLGAFAQAARKALNGSTGPRVGLTPEDAHPIRPNTQTIAQIEGWIGDINPKYDPSAKGNPYNVNCGSCAESVFNHIDGKPLQEAEARTYSVAEMAEKIGLPQVPMSPEQIMDEMIKGGKGTHAVIGIDRWNLETGRFESGHWFNAYFDGERVVAVDGQNGLVVPWPPAYLQSPKYHLIWDAAIK